MNKKISFPIAIIIIVVCAVLVGLLITWQYRLIPEIKPSGPSPKPPAKEVTITTDKTEYIQGETVKIIVKNNLDKSVWYEDYTIINYSFLGIEKFEKDKWEPLIKFKFNEEEKTFPIAKFDFPFRGPWDSEKVGMCCASEGGGNCYRVFDMLPYVTNELKPNSEIFYQLDQKVCPKEKVEKAGLSAKPFQPVYFEPEFIEKGRYRIVFEYGLSTEELPGSEMPEFKGGILVKDKKTIYSNEFTIKYESGDNPIIHCGGGSCKCMKEKECESYGGVYIIPTGEEECSVNSDNKMCCCPGV